MDFVSQVTSTSRITHPVTISRYTNLHLWMIIPMAIMQLGIFMDYWGDFSDNAWSVHIHYATGTLWYLFLIIQPYLATHGHSAKHRTYGIIGMFLGGGVALTALSMMHRDIATAHRSAEFADRFGAFQPWFFYGVASVEIVMMTTFIYALIQGIFHRKELENHSWWLISSVFIIMMPALGRGVQNVWLIMSPASNIMTPVYFAELIIITFTIWAAVKYGRLKHPATYLALGVNVLNCLLEPIGRSKAIQAFLESAIKG